MGWRRLLLWIGCTVVISISPIVWRWGGLFLDGRAVDTRILFGDGELFLIACALAAAGLGDVLGIKLNNWALLAAMGCVFSAINSAWAYSHLHGPGEHPPDAVVRASLISFALTVAASTVCVLVSDKSRRSVLN
jgi:hypothetical protein